MHSTSSRGEASPVDGSILSRCPDGKVVPRFLFLIMKRQAREGGAKPDAIFITQASQNSGSFKVSSLPVESTGWGFGGFCVVFFVVVVGF